jgi:hypothetical protein
MHVPKALLDAPLARSLSRARSLLASHMWIHVDAAELEEMANALPKPSDLVGFRLNAIEFEKVRHTPYPSPLPWGAGASVCGHARYSGRMCVHVCVVVPRPVV